MDVENDYLRRRCDELFHALACALTVPEPQNEEQEIMLRWARSFMTPKMAHDVAAVALHKYAAQIGERFECPLMKEDCSVHCGGYGCGG